MQTLLPPTLLGIGPFGTVELIIVAVLMGLVGLVVGGIVFVVLANKKK